MRKLISILLAVVMVVSVAAIAVNAADNGTATVTMYDLMGGSITETYAVGDTFTATVYLNISGLGNNRIGSLSGVQYYDPTVVEIADEYVTDESSYDFGSVYDLKAMFPICGGGGVANAGISGEINFNSSTPSIAGAYLFDDDDDALIVVNYKVIAAGSIEIQTHMETLAQADYDLTRIFDKGEIVNDKFSTGASLTAPNLPVKTGSTVSGTVTSFSDNSDEDKDVTVEILDGETVVGSFTGTGNSLAYEIEGIADGDYTLRVSKENHVTRAYDITVSGDTTADAKIHLLGDIDGNGRVTVADAGKINNHIKKKATLTGYEFDCADVDGNGRITVADAGKLNNHIKKKALLW